MPVYPSYDSITGGLVYHVVPDPPTHAQSISDIVSETESDMSGMTIFSDDASTQILQSETAAYGVSSIIEYFIEYYGRQQPASENAIRWFPADNTRRYILRHVVDKYVLGFNYFGPVKELLAGPGHQVLEIGTRDGTWTQEMAAEFPHVQFRSVDIAPIIAHVPQQNILFEVYDIGEGLMVEDNSQDCVFVNMSVELVRDYRALLREAHRVLKPHGLLHVREFSPGIWDPQNEFKFPRATAPLACRLFDIIRESMVKLGADPDMCDKLPAWLRPGSDLWEGCGPKVGFERIGSIVKSCATYPHDNYPCSAKMDRRFGPLIGHLYWVCLRDSLGMLRESGLSDEEANQLIADVIEESKNPAKCPMGCIPSKKSLSTRPEMDTAAVGSTSQLNTRRISTEKLDELLPTPNTPLSPTSMVKPSVSLTDQMPLPRRPDCIAPRPTQPESVPERRNKVDHNAQDQGGNTTAGATTAFGAAVQGDAAVGGAGDAGADGGGGGE